MKKHKRVDPAQFYNKTWQKASQFYGAQGKPAPLMQFGPISVGEGGQVSENPDGRRVVTLSPNSKRDIRRGGSYWGSGVDKRKAIKRTLLHEWAHVYQNDDLYNKQRDLPYLQQPMEMAASSFASNAWQRLNRDQKINAAKRQGDKHRVKKLRHRPPFAPLDTSQFGSNYGADPTTITYPGWTPAS